MCGVCLILIYTCPFCALLCHFFQIVGAVVVSESSQCIFIYSCKAIWEFCYTCIVSFPPLFISHVNTYLLILQLVALEGGAAAAL